MFIVFHMCSPLFSLYCTNAFKSMVFHHTCKSAVNCKFHTSQISHCERLIPMCYKFQYFTLLGEMQRAQSQNLCMAKNYPSEVPLSSISFFFFFFFFFFLIQFYVPFKLFHSYRDESIGRWGENRSTRGKTT